MDFQNGLFRYCDGTNWNNMIAGPSTTCSASTEGALRYNSSSKKMEFCNGTSWGNVSVGTNATITIGSPSVSLVKAGTVTYEVTYGSGTDSATINLVATSLTFAGAGSAGCTASVTGSGLSRTVSVNNCTGTGAVNFSIPASTAYSTTGDAALSAGPSTSFNADNTGPNAPTGVTLGSIPANLTTSPTITYTAPSDVGGSTVAGYQARILRTSDSAVAFDWGSHTNGTSVTGLSLSPNTQYSVFVRALDAFGNIGTSTTATNYTSTNTAQYDFHLWGAGAGTATYGAGGGGGYAGGTMTLVPGGSITVVVGCTASGLTGGTPGGGNGTGAGSGGGGYSAVKSGSTFYLIAGGGGGDGWGPLGGQGGGTNGGRGAAWDSGDDTSESGDGGTQSAGGTGRNGTSGSYLQGGNSGACSYAGGGGAGCYGSGGGGGAGGGGSGYFDAVNVSGGTLMGGAQGSAAAANASSPFRPAGNGAGWQPGAVVIRKGGVTQQTYSTCGTYNYTLP